MTFITNLINGVSLGSIYAVIALGYTMVYGIAKMLNFAHGDVIMVGAYIVFALTSYAGVNPYLALVISMAACTLLGMAIERFAYKPLRGASPLAVLITAIGVSYFLQNMALLIFGSQAKSFTSIVNLPALTLAGGKITISAETIVTIIVSLIIMVSLTLFVNKTKPGRATLPIQPFRSGTKHPLHRSCGSSRSSDLLMKVTTPREFRSISTFRSVSSCVRSVPATNGLRNSIP